MSSSPANWEPPLPEELQLLLPQYEITGILGRGGMGAVYKGRQAKLDRPVAIKLLPEILSGDDESMNFVKRFEQEARAMANLDHPAIISVYDFGETSQGQFYFVMEFVDGMDIHQYLEHHGGKIPQEHALSITAHVLDALAYAHSRGIVHRDIKPANILLNRDGKIKIADFGLAKKFGTGADDNAPALTMSNVAVGTPDYVAPEALEKGAATDHRADLYAVGVMLYQMLTGKLPRGMIRLPSELDPEIDPRIDQVVSKALEADPDRRYQDASAIRVDLDVVSSRPMTKIQAGASSRAVPAAVPATPTIQYGGRPQVSRQPQGWQAPKPQTRTPVEGAPRKSSATKLYSGVGVAAVLLIGALVMIMGGGDKPGTKDAPPLAAVEDTGVPPQVEPPPTPPLAPQPAPQPGPEPRPAPQEPTPPTPSPPVPPEPRPGLAGPPDMSKPVQVFIIMGGSNAVGLAHVNPPETPGTLSSIVNRRPKRHFQHLLDKGGNWLRRNDVYLVERVDRDHRERWLGPGSHNQVGIELQFGHVLGDLTDAPILLIKSCTGNRSLGWDLLPPGSERFEHGNLTYPGYGETPESWPKGSDPPPPGHQWHAGKQYDMDVANAKEVLANIDRYFPGNSGYEIAGFVWWTGSKDMSNPGHVQRYEQNLVAQIKNLRQVFDAPEAKFVIGAGDGANVNSAYASIVAAELAVDGNAGKYPEFAGNVATVVTQPFIPKPDDSPLPQTPLAFYHNAWPMLDIGTEMGRAMAGMLGDNAAFGGTDAPPQVGPGDPRPEPPGGQPRSPLQDLPPSPAQERLAALEAEIRTAYTAAVEVPFNENRAELEGKFRGAVERTITTAEEPLKRKLEADLGRLDRGEELPGADVDQEFPLLVRLRATWHQEFARIEDARQAIEKEFWVPWQAALGELEQEFTSSGEAAPAAATFALRQQLHTEFTGEAAPEAPAPPAEVADPAVEQPPSQPAPPQGESFVLFDGRSLDGWTATGSPRVFTVDRDTIKATGGVGHLIYSADVHHGRRFRDFDFKARVKTEDEAVAGIFFHVVSTDETALNEGIGVQIHNGTNPNKTGGIISMPPHDKLTVADGEWFDLEISVRRNLVTTRVNGEIVLERQGEGALEGTFALHCGLSERGTTWFQGLEVQTYLDPLTALCAVPREEAFQREFPDYERMPSGTIHRFGFGENGDPLDGKMPTNRDFVAVVTAGDHWVGLRSNGTVRSSNPDWENSRNRIGRLFNASGRIGLVKNDGSPLYAERDLVSRSRWHLDGERLYDWALGYNSNLALGIDGRVDGDFYNPGKDPGVLMPPIGPTDIIDLSVIGVHYYGLRSNGKMVLIGVREGPDVPEIPAEAKIVEISEGSFGDAPHILALADNGEVFVIGGGDDAWGKNGIPEGLRARKVRTGRGISAAQREDGTWVAWGENKHGIVTKINGFGPKVIDLAPDLRSVSWIEEN